MTPKPSPVTNPLTSRLLRRLLMAAALCVVAMTAVRALWEQHSVMREFDAAVEDIGRSQSKPLANSLWDYDRRQALLQLEAICKSPAVRYAAVTERNQVFAESGSRNHSASVRELPLEYEQDGRSMVLGTLVLQTDLGRARERVMVAASMALALHTVLVGLIAGLLFLLIRGMVSRHLETAAAHFARISGTASENDLPDLKLDKKPAGDELDLLANAVNSMQESRVKSFRKLLAAEHEARSQALFPESNPNPVMRVSADGVLVTANAASRKILEELDSAPGFKAPDIYLAPVQQALAQNRLVSFEAEALGRTFAFVARPLPDEAFVNIYGMDITARVRAEAEVLRSMNRLQCLVRVLQHEPTEVQAFLDFCLAEALALTESSLGYIFHYSEERREFTLHAWSKGVMEQCAVHAPATVYKLEDTGVRGEPVRQRRAVVMNDFAAESPLKRGFPEGHVQLENFMSVPIMRDGRIVAVAGVANRPGGYSGTDVLEFSLLMDACWQVVGRMEAEAGVLRSLHEKEILLKEIHHRVKNNMQVISSLLFLQMQHVKDPRDVDLFAESQKRIQAMALVHEELYGSNDLSSVNMREYVPRLVERVAAGSAVPVTTQCSVEEIRLPITRSIPCGLLLNELVMNSVKHACHGRSACRVEVRLARRGGDLVLSVEDDGPGLPPGFDMNVSETLGMTLVSSLAAQLGGRVEAENTSAGALFRLIFPAA
jgi:two-component sensor histidine kinase